MGTLRLIRDGVVIGSVPVTVGASPYVANKHATPATFSAVASSAAAGDVIALAAGDYGTWTGARYSGYVTFLPEPGASAKITPAFNTSGGGARTYTRWVGLNVGNVDIGKTTTNDPSNGSAHHQFIGCTFAGSRVWVPMSNGQASDLLIEGCTFRNYQKSGPEGSVTLGSGVKGVTIRECLFEDVSPYSGHDFIQNYGNDVLIERNVLRHIHLVGGTHGDAIQTFGRSNVVIRQNYFKDVTNGVVAYDGCAGHTIEDNIFDGRNDNPWSIVLLSDTGSVVRHNTVVGNPQRTSAVIRLGNNATKGLPASSGTEFYNNIAYSFGDDDNGGTPNQHHNNWYGSSVSGAGNVSGVSTFAGGGTTSTLDFPEFDSYDDARAYFLLAAGTGRGSGVGGVDMGVR